MKFLYVCLCVSVYYIFSIKKKKLTLNLSFLNITISINKSNHLKFYFSILLSIYIINIDFMYTKLYAL